MRRREFLGRLAGVAAAAALPPSLAGALVGIPSCSPRATHGRQAGVDDAGLSPAYPLRDRVARFLEHQAASPGFVPTGLSSSDYLDVIAPIVDFFTLHQRSNGAIVDPQRGRETQYATPAFALAKALLIAAGVHDDAESRASVGNAMDWAIERLVSGVAADHHGDFYTALLVPTYELLRAVLPAPVTRKWADRLRQLRPPEAYSNGALPSTPERVSNWDLASAAGEFLRYRSGLSGSRMYADRRIPLHLQRMTDHGMYVDVDNAMAYDLFARHHLLLMLARDYDGPGRELMEARCLRGAWTSLLIQSPCGEMPCGGRSGHHQWNEALECALFEFFAALYARRGQFAIAGAFRRGARLALQSIRRWRRPSGELWIAKNRHRVGERWGFEKYSFHSQYNLLTAAVLAVAFQRARQEIPERPAPADTGGFCITIDDGVLPRAGTPGFHKTFANAQGFYLQIERAGDPAYNPTGLLRLHRRVGATALRGISDGAVRDPGFNVGAASRAGDTPRGLAIAPGWLGTDDRWHSLAELGVAELAGRSAVTVHAERPGAVDFRVAYRISRAGCEEIRRHYALRADELVIRDEVRGDVAATRCHLTFLEADGRERAQVEVAERTITSRVGDVQQSYRILEPAEVHIAADPHGTQGQSWMSMPFRDGMLGAAIFEARSRSMTYAVTLQEV